MTDMPLFTESGPVFVGRDPQLELLRDHARRAREQAPGMVLIGGDAGIGKSRLVSEFVAGLKPGTVFVGNCLQLGVDGLSYSPFTAVLRQLLREHGRTVFDEAAPGGHGEFARLLPELGPVPADRPEIRGVLFEQVLRLLHRAAEPDGITVVLEDLHWADGASRDLLVFLLRNLDLPGVQLVGTYRSDDLHRTHPLRRLLPELERLPGVVRRELEPLTRGEVAVQAASLHGGELSAQELDTLYRRTEGVPLYVESLVGSLTRGTESELPDHFRDLLLEPLHRFDETAVSVLRVASVGAVSGTIEHETLRHAADLSEDRLEEALRALVDANALRVDGTGYRFRHALLRDAVHGELLPGPHTRLHLRFAQLIDEYPDAVPADRRDAEQAHHYFAAQERPSALAATWQAAVRAHDALAFQEQLTLLERVLTLWDQVPDAQERVHGHSWAEVVSAASAAALEAGENRRALELADEALATLPQDSDGDHDLMMRAVLLRRRGLARSNTSTSDGGMDDLELALKLHPPHMRGYGSLLSVLAREHFLHRSGWGGTSVQARLAELSRQRQSVRELAEESIAVAASERPTDLCAAADARITLGSLHMGEGNPDLGRPLIEEGIRYATQTGDPDLEARGAGNLAHMLRELGHHRESLEVLEESLRRHRSLEWASMHISYNHQNRAEAFFEMGDLAGAAEAVESSLLTHPLVKHRHYIQSAVVRTAAAQGDLAKAREILAGSKALNSAQTCVVRFAALARLETDLVEGTVDPALGLTEWMLDGMGLEVSPGYLWPLLDTMAEVVRRAAALGSAERAGRVRALVGELATAVPAHGVVQRAHQESLTARFTQVDGAEPRTQLAAWTGAVAAWEHTELRLHLAWARLRAAEAAVPAGERKQADGWVRAAHSAAVGSGAVPLAEAALGLARRLGISLAGAPEPPAPPAGLTDREVEVARLLAVGSTNARIAEELFISTKTASVHVSNILAKLAVDNRAEAGVRLRALGLA